jgi:hypothetical protein
VRRRRQQQLSLLKDGEEASETLATASQLID